MIGGCMNKRGFTLVELLGVIVILSIIMLIAIPNVTSVLERSKKDTYIADAKKMVSLVQYAIRQGTVNKPTAGNLEKVTLGTLATSEVEKDPDGYTYDLDESYVVIVIKDGYLVYYVQLVVDTNTDENKASSYRGIRLTNVDDLDGDTRYEKYKKNISLPTDAEISSKITSND